VTRRALVTGCSSGIGNAVTRALLSDGWIVIGVSRSKPALIAHDAFIWEHCDLRRPWQIMKGAWRMAPRLDAVVHCAAIQGPVGKLEDSDPLEWAECVKVNLLATYEVVRTTLPFLRESDDARMLLFSGGGSFSPRPRYSAYAASKAGVVALMESLAPEIPPVTVNCVAPGFVPTPIHNATLEAGPERAGCNEWGRVVRAAGQCADEAMAPVVACVRHLLSDETRGLTGKTISVPHDGWRDIRESDVAYLNDSEVWTRARISAMSDRGVLV